MSYIDKAKNLIRFLSNKSIKDMASDDLKITIAACISGDPVGKAEAIKKTITDIVHFPTYMFWDKMERFLRGTFHDFDDQIKMASRFDPETDDYAKFTVNLVSILNQIDIDEKVDYYANLARAFLQECLDKELFFKLSKYLLQCTMDELSFLQRAELNYTSTNSMMVSALFQYGLMEQTESINGERRYKLSDFAKALKQNSLNFYNDLSGTQRISSYKDMKPPVLPSKAETWEDLASIDTKNENIIFHDVK